MMNKDKAKKRILAIDPTTSGLAFVILQGPNMIVDWGLKGVRGNKETETLEKVKKLIALYKPDVVAIQKPETSPRCGRIREILAKTRALAKEQDCRAHAVSAARVKKHWQARGLLTKYQRASDMADEFPELQQTLPKKRRPWASEDTRFNIFDALEIGLSWFYPSK